jgi:hypothetical protein
MPAAKFPGHGSCPLKRTCATAASSPWSAAKNRPTRALKCLDPHRHQVAAFRDPVQSRRSTQAATQLRTQRHERASQVPGGHAYSCSTTHRRRVDTEVWGILQGAQVSDKCGDRGLRAVRASPLEWRICTQAAAHCAYLAFIDLPLAVWSIPAGLAAGLGERATLPPSRRPEPTAGWVCCSGLPGCSPGTRPTEPEAPGPG